MKFQLQPSLSSCHKVNRNNFRHKLIVITMKNYCHHKHHIGCPQSWTLLCQRCLTSSLQILFWKLDIFFIYLIKLPVEHDCYPFGLAKPWIVHHCFRLTNPWGRWLSSSRVLKLREALRSLGLSSSWGNDKNNHLKKCGESHDFKGGHCGRHPGIPVRSPRLPEWWHQIHARWAILNNRYTFVINIFWQI